MGLRRALEQLPEDSAAQAAAGRVMQRFRRSEGMWVPKDAVRDYSDDPHLLERVLTALVDTGVLDFRDDPPSYRYTRDPLVDIWLDRFEMRTSFTEQRVRKNVERFRRRFGG